ncbi:hypothetical protein ACFL96_07475 [Thermoproteota archaeon]
MYQTRYKDISSIEDVMIDERVSRLRKQMETELAILRSTVPANRDAYCYQRLFLEEQFTITANKIVKEYTRVRV